jgi:hypothetical protein
MIPQAAVVSWAFAALLLIGAIRDCTNPESRRYRRAYPITLQVLEVGVVAGLGYLISAGRSALVPAALAVFGILWVLWVQANAKLRRGWDFFFSYKSENANEVRRIAERLMASGFRVWFAEYEVLLRTYDEFQRLIKQGVKGSSFGVLFTTETYAGSRHCAMEVEWLKARFARRPRHLIEVSLQEPNDARRSMNLPPDSARIVASLSPRASDRSGEDVRLVAELVRLAGLGAGAAPALPPCLGSAARFRARCAPVSFETVGFERTEWKTHAADGTDIASFVCRRSPVPFSFNVRFHWAPESAPGVGLTIRGDPLDDRTLYGELRQYATWWLGRMRRRGVFLKERGLHLFWLDGRTQLALTHSALSVRMRKYSVIVSALPQPLQILFTFGVTGGVRDFCQLAPLMDQIVESVALED